MPVGVGERAYISPRLLPRGDDQVSACGDGALDQGVRAGLGRRADGQEAFAVAGQGGLAAADGPLESPGGMGITRAQC